MSEIRMKYLYRHQEPYGETLTVWEIRSGLPEDKVWEFCQREILSNRFLPTKEQWEEMLRKSDKDDDAEMNFETYAKGWCELVKFGGDVWRFVKHTPNLD